MPSSYDADPTSISLNNRIAALCEAEHDIARIQARQLRLIAAIAADPRAAARAPDLDKEFVKEELRAALGQSATAVANRIGLARELTERLPTALAALEAGELTLRHVQLLTEATAALDDAAATAVEAAAVPFAAGRDLAAFARKVRREALKADPHAGGREAEAAVDGRRVWIGSDTAATGFVGAILPAEGAQALLAGLDVLADRPSGPDDARTREQRRADALVQLGIDALNGYPTCAECGTRTAGAASTEARAQEPWTRQPRSSRPRWQGLRPTVQISVALSTPLHLDDRPGRARRARSHPRQRGPSARRRPHRHLAPAGHRPARPAHRLWPHPVPAPGRPARVCPGPRHHLPLPHLHPDRPP